MIYERKPGNEITIKTALLDAERAHRPVTFYTRTWHFIGAYKAIDAENKPITLYNFITHGGLVYYKTDRYNWKTISIDDILKINIKERPQHDRS